MLTYWLKCNRDTENVDSEMLKTKNGGTILFSKCTLSGSKKSKFMKEQEAKGLLSSLSLRNSLSKISLLDDILFKFKLCIK